MYTCQEMKKNIFLLVRSKSKQGLNKPTNCEFVLKIYTFIFYLYFILSTLAFIFLPFMPPSLGWVGPRIWAATYGDRA